VERGTGARVLAWANHLATLAYLVERDANDAPILQSDGRPKFVLDGNGAVQLDPAHPGADLELRRYVGSIDLYRQLVTTFEQPLGDLPEPP
jgi:hypothetical protein